MCSFLADDEAIGMAGTIAKYVSERGKVIKVVFSSGEKSSPHLREDYVKKERSKETDIACSYIGICESINLNLKDTMLKKEIERSFVAKRVRELIMLNRPEKIFIPSAKDPHPDHRAVFYALEKALNGRVRKPKIFTFMIWGLFNPNDSATFYVRTDDYFEDKIKALQVFKTQKLIVALFYLPMFIRDRLGGIRNKCKYAETFYVENA